MKITKIGVEAQNVSRWSGGTTTQLAICPRCAQYADRDFLWRVSSAVVELPESDFTPLPDYDRILMILEGELSLSHDGGEEYRISTLEQTSFDGASRTFSRGQVTDFNLMMRKGRCAGRVEALVLKRNEWRGVVGREFDGSLFYCASGSAEISMHGESCRLEKGDALLAEEIREITECRITGDAAVILAEMKTF